WAGWAGAYALYFKRGLAGDELLTSRVRGLRRALANKLYVDELYGWAVVRPIWALARGLWRFVDATIIDGLFVNGIPSFIASIPLWTGFRATPGRYAFEQKSEWAPALGFSYHVGLDGVALLLFLLTAFLGPIVVLSSWKYIQERVKVYCISLLLLETAMLGTLAALDLVLFYVFWEAMLIPMYLLIGMWGSERRIYAAVKFFLFTFIGLVLMLLAIFWLWSNSGKKSFDYVDLLNS